MNDIFKMLQDVQNVFGGERRRECWKSVKRMGREFLAWLASEYVKDEVKRIVFWALLEVLEWVLKEFFEVFG